MRAVYICGPVDGGVTLGRAYACVCARVGTEIFSHHTRANATHARLDHSQSVCRLGLGARILLAGEEGHDRASVVVHRAHDRRHPEVQRITNTAPASTHQEVGKQDGQKTNRHKKATMRYLKKKKE